MRRSAQAVFVAVLFTGACTFSSGTDEKTAVAGAYTRFHQAVIGGDLKTAVSLVSAERAAELTAPDAAEKFQFAGALMPPQISIARIDISGPEATIHATGRVDNATATGTVTARKEGGSWKIGHESWNVSMRLDAGAGPFDSPGSLRASAIPRRPDVERPNAEEYAKLRGQWKGSEVGGSSEWTFSFGDAYAVVVNDGERSYEGLAAFHPELGAGSDGSIRVSPGSGVIDIDVVQGSATEYAGKTSLGMYFFTSPTELKLCGSRPGALIRVQSYDTSSREVRCFNLVKASDEPLSSTLAAAAPAPDPVPATAPPAPQEKGDPGVTGEASLLLDGVPQRYALRTGFFYDTRFKNPKRATIQFQPERSGNLTSGLVLTLDATQSGPRTTDGDGTQINWIADGGQVFPPRSTCAVRVTSPYSGSGPFRGEIDHCVVHSAGIEHTISSVRFVMVGAPSR
jgi:hypothetical protein